MATLRLTLGEILKLGRKFDPKKHGKLLRGKPSDPKRGKRKTARKPKR